MHARRKGDSRSNAKRPGVVRKYGSAGRSAWSGREVRVSLRTSDTLYIVALKAAVSESCARLRVESPAPGNRMFYSLNFLCRIEVCVSRCSLTRGAAVNPTTGRRCMLAPLERNVQHQADIRHLRARQILQHRYKVKQLVVVRIAEPAADRHCMLRVEDVAGWRVVDDDRLP